MILINSTTLYILRNQVVARAVPPARFIYKYLNINSSNLAQETCRGSFFKWFRHSQVPFGLSSWPTLPRKDATTCCQHWPNRKNTPNAHRHQIQSTKNKSCRQQSPPAPAKPPSSQNLCESPPIFLHPPLCNNLPQTDDEFTNSHLKTSQQWRDEASSSSSPCGTTQKLLERPARSPLRPLWHEFVEKCAPPSLKPQTSVHV